jgi:nucleoside-diphosphate-sugar epimerase
MRVLVTGNDGYIGAQLAPYLIDRGHDVVGVDTGFYRAGWLYNGVQVSAQTLNKDIRLLTEEDFADVDAVVHMAELSNDPLAHLSSDATYAINHEGSLHVAAIAKAAGVSRFVYTSSCSVYGAAAEEFVDEESPLRPQTTYAICKELVERDVAQMADDDFSPTFLRNATAYGASPRMRFDIVLNNLSGLAWTTKEIRLESDGTPWRPLVHVLDICQAVDCVLDAPRERIHNQVLNVGDASGNYQIREIAEIVAGVFPGCEVTVAGRSPDARSYRVWFAKIHEILPEFECKWNAELGARQLHDVFSLIGLEEEDFLSRRYTRLKQIEYLLKTGQIDDSFLWKEALRPSSAPGNESWTSVQSSDATEA